MSYNEFFGFSDAPFLDAPDLRFLFLAKQHEVILAELTELITFRQGIAVVSGDDGVGKTILTQALIQRLPSGYQAITITQPVANPLAATLKIAQSLAVTLREKNLLNLTPLVEAMQDAARQGKFFLALFDDAHLLTDQHLEEIYFLSQMEYQGQQLMPIMLVGRQGLEWKLDSNHNQRLGKLVQQHHHLTGLTSEETIQYIDHRLKQVGSSFASCFAEDCSDQLFAQTGGIPRRINQECHEALNRAWQEHRAKVTRDLLTKEPHPADEPRIELPEQDSPENQADQAIVEEAPPVLTEEPPFPPEPQTAPSEQSSPAGYEAQIVPDAGPQNMGERAIYLPDNPAKSMKVSWWHLGVIGVLAIALIISLLAVLRKTSSIKQDVRPTLKTMEEPIDKPKTAVPPYSPPAKQLSTSPSISEGKDLEALIKQVREAQLQKNIKQFLEAYSPNFANLGEKKKEVLRTWQKYDYLDLSFKLEDIKQKTANTISARVIWDITLREVDSNKKIKLVKDYPVHFSKFSGKWLIQSIKEKD